MSLPKQVQRQLDDVSAFEKSLETPAPTETETPPENPNPEEAKVVEPKPVQTPAPVPPKDDSHVWEARYKSLQGMFNAEVPRLQKELVELKGQLAALQTKPSEAKTAQEPEPYKTRTTAKDVETFGGELVDLIERKASDVAAEREASLRAEIKRLENDNAKLREDVGGVAEKQGVNARQTYFAQLSQQVPDYEAVNGDPGFLEWLAAVDQLSGLPRQAYLTTAFDRFDVQRTAALFNEFKKTRVAQESAPASKDPPPEIKRQVAPTASKAAPAAASTDAKSFSVKEVEKFYADVARGAYRGKEAERAQIESTIDLAVSQGRITK